jgi:pimeloyl-ACP methyl ester carboxylesterase
VTLVGRARALLGGAALAATPDLPVAWLHQLTHRALLAAGAEQWTARLSGFRVQRYALDGRGSGPAVLLLHGLNGSAGSMASLLPAVRRRASRVVLLDLPAHGRSAKVPAAPSVLDYAAVVTAAVDELCRETGGPVALVGNSLGGALALLVAAEQPDLVAAVVGLNPAGAPLADEAVGRLPASFPDPQSGARQMARLLFSRTPPYFWLVGRDIARGWAGPTVQRILGEARDGRHQALSHRLLEKVQSPVLVLWGEDDRLLPRESLASFRRIPGATIEVVPECGHMPQLERPRWTARRVGRFLAAV